MPSSAEGPKPPGITPADLDGRLLRYLLAVVREGSIRRAGAALNVAPSAISRQIAELEQRLGLPLLERLPRGVVPTEAGTALAEHARQQADETESLLDYLKQLHGLRRGAVRIHAGEGFVGDLLENGLPAFAAAHPHIRLRLLLGGTPEIMEAVAESRADIGLAYNPASHAGVRSAAIARQPLCVLVAPGHALAGRAAVTLRELAEVTLALLTPQHGIRQLMGRAEAEQGLHLVPHLESGSIDVLRRMALAGRAATLLPRFAAAAEVATGHLHAVTLAEPALASATAHLLVRAQRRLPGAVERLVGMLAAGMQAFRPLG